MWTDVSICLASSSLTFRVGCVVLRYVSSSRINWAVLNRFRVRRGCVSSDEMLEDDVARERG